MSTELTLLQQQVADLWRRFKAPEETTMDDGSVTRLAERVAALERQRRGLMERRTALQLEVGRERARLAGRLPAWSALGFVAGLGAVGGALGTWPEVLLVAAGLPDGAAVGLLTGSLLLGALAVRR